MHYIIKCRPTVDCTSCVVFEIPEHNTNKHIDTTIIDNYCKVIYDHYDSSAYRESVTNQKQCQ